MDPTAAGNLIAATGVWVQLLGTALLLTLFYLLSRHAGARPYFVDWAWGWLALFAALTLVTVRYLSVVASNPRVGGVIGFLLHGGYFFGKLVHLLLLVGGTWRFTRERAPPGPALAWMGGALLLAAAVAFGSQDLNPIMIAQGPVAAVGYLAGATLLLQLPLGRRTMGTRFTAGVMAGLGLLWALYWLGFANQRFGWDLSWPMLLVLLNINSYLDTAASLMLAFGMVVILLEDERGEAEMARAQRLRDVAMSEARLRAVLETATDGIIAANPEGRIVIANASATRLFGLRRREAVGRNLSELFTDPGRDTLERSLIDIRRATPGRQSLFEVAARTPDGGAIPLEVAVSVMAHEGELLDILVLRDLRDRRRAEAEREQLQTRLAQSLRMESLGRLVSGVAHELNNPLAAILTFSEQLLAERAIGEEAGPLTTIREQARRARAIVRDLLAFVRRREDRREAADLAVLVDRTVRALQGDIDRGGVKLTVELAPNLPLITCNPPALEQVLTNLVDNAVRAAPRGKVELRVRQDQGCLEVEVNDSGPGIRPEHLSRIFEPFFTTRATGEGTGLGLSVSLGILQQHGGDLRAENRLPGPGARFVARIPVGGARPPAGAQPPADRPVLGGGRRVLIIDDEEPIRSSLRRYFMRQDWAVDEAADGSLGLARMLDGVGYDLVICDLKMPGLSGAEVYHQVRVARPDLLRHLVFASGDTASPETAAFLDSTSTPVLEKPFELSELRAVVDRVLNLAD